MFRLLSLLTLVSAAFSSAAFADTDIAKACGTLNRPNIDCACVAKRVDTMQQNTKSQLGKTVVNQGYLWELNLPNTYLANSRALYDSADLMDFDQAMNEFGGIPDEISDYEQGCVIPGAPLPSVPKSDPGSFVTELANICTAGGDSSKARYCACYADRKARHVSKQELEAHFRGLSDFLGRDIKSADEKHKSHAEIMGVSQTTYDALIKSANKKIDANAGDDDNYCEALTWADKLKGSDQTIRKNGGFSEEVLKKLQNNTTADPEETKTLGKLAQAEDIIKASCKSAGNNASQCACWIKDFRDNVVAEANNDREAYAWALFLHGNTGMSQSDFLTALQAVPQEDQIAAGPLMASTPRIGQNCK